MALASTLVLLGLTGTAVAQEPLPMPMPVPMPGAPPPAPLPPPQPVPEPVSPGPMPMPVPLGPSTPSGGPLEDLPPIDFIPAARPRETPSVKYALSYQGEWWWVPVGPVTGPMSDVAVKPDSSIYAGVTRTGEVWITTDAGLGWRKVLVGIAQSRGDATQVLDLDEAVQDVLSDVDADAVGNLDPYSGDGQLDDVSGQLEAELDALGDRASQWEAIEAQSQGGTRDAPHPRLWFDGDVLFVGRADGMYRTEDLGSSWRKVLDVEVTAFIHTPRGWIAGTSDGMRYSDNGLDWYDRQDGSEGLAVIDLLDVGDGTAFAGTRAGLWYTADGTFWGQRFAFEEPVLLVALDPDVEGRLWVSLPSTILSSDTGGLNFEEPLTAPMPAVTEMIHLGPLHWACVSGDGPWETMNGGLSWVPIARGLLEPDVQALEAVDGVLVIAGVEGIFRIERAPDLVFDPDSQAALLRDELAEWIPRDALIGSALARKGLSPKAGGSRWLRYLMPEVWLGGQYRVVDGVDYSSGLSIDDLEDLDLTGNGGTVREFDRWWRADLRLRWTPPGRRRAALSTPALDTSGIDVGGMGISDDVPISGRAGRKASAYKLQVARRVNELYNARADALQRRVEVSRAPLLQQVQLELYIAEIEGELDALTSGAVSSFVNLPPAAEGAP